MSSFNLTKKLLTAKKSWKSFTNTIRSRFHKLEIPKPIKKTTSCLVIPSKVLRKGKSSARGSRRYMVQKESSRNIIRPFITKGSSYHRHHIHHQHNMEKNFAAIFVDELFAEPTYTFGEPSKEKEVGSSSSSLQSTNKATSMDVQKQKHAQPTREGANMVLDEAVPRKRNESETSSTSAAAWEELRNTCKSLPQLPGVDERAEEFISKFRQDLKLEREQSIIDFQEMLARSV